MISQPRSPVGPHVLLDGPSHRGFSQHGSVRGGGGSGGVHRHRFGATVLALICSGLPTAVHAQDAPAAFHLQYQAPERCPSQAAFLQELGTRSRRIRVARADEAARLYRVDIRRTPQGAAGSLTTDFGGLRSDTREVVGRTCEEVVSALALTAAISLDPDARMTAATVPVPSNGANSTSTPSGDAVARPNAASSVDGPHTDDVKPPVTSKPSPEKSVSDPSKSEERLKSQSTSRLAPQHDPRWTMGAGPRVWAGVFDAPLVGGALFWGGRLSDAPHSTSYRIWATWQQDFESSVDRKVRVTIAAAGLSVCPLRWLAPPLIVEGCVEADSGVVRATGKNLRTARVANGYWLSAGLSVQAFLWVSPHFGLSLAAGPAVPLTRAVFFTDDAHETVESAHTLGARAGFFAAYRF